MWRKTQLSIVVTATLLLCLCIQAVIEWLTGQAPSPLKLSSVIIFLLATVLVAVFNFTWRAIWARIPALAKVAFPDINGTWKGTLHSNWKDPKTGLSPGPIETTVWIRQTLLSVSVRQQTKESPSWSTPCLFRRTPKLIDIDSGTLTTTDLTPTSPLFRRITTASAVSK
jgi:SMODS-associating 2TM, beta-strand rich effector domain